MILIWLERDDMGDDMGSYHPPYHPSYHPVGVIWAHIIPQIIPQIQHKNVKIVVLSSKSTVPAGDLDLNKQSRGTRVDMA